MKTINLDFLSDSDVIKLIRALKKSIDLNQKKMSIPISGMFNFNLKLRDKFYGVSYILHARRGRIQNNKYSIHIRLTGNNEHLLRLCINGSRHKNSDGTEASGDHLHIYKIKKGQITHDAIDLKKHKCVFNATDDLAEALDKFMIVTNVEGR